MSDWVALGRDTGGAVGYILRGGQVAGQAEGAGTAAILGQLNAGDLPVLRIGSGGPSVLPAPVLALEGATLPSLTQTQPADVISAWVRLWVAGYLGSHPNWDGVVCVLHGDVLHWLHVSADEVISSATSLTPRLFECLGLGEATPDEQALADTLSRPERLMTHLRAAEVSGDAGACLGHFIGADLAATRAYWLGQQAVVIGEGMFAKAYAQALAAQGVPTDLAIPDEVLQRGFAALAALKD